MAKEYDEKHIRVTRVQPNASLRSSRDTYRSSRRGEHGSGVVIWLADGATGLLFIQRDVQMYMCVWVNSMAHTPPKNLRVRQSSSNRPHRHRRLAFGRDALTSFVFVRTPRARASGDDDADSDSGERTRDRRRTDDDDDDDDERTLDMLDAVARRGLARTGLLGQVSALDEVRGALGELRESAREGATRAVRGVSEALGKAGKREPGFGRGGRDGVIRLRGRATRGVDGGDNNVLRCDPRLRGKFLAAMIPGDSAVESVITSGIYSTLNIYNTLLIGRLILTWFPNPPRQLMYPLATLCDPYLGLFRGIIPPLGGIDLSPILAFTVLNVFQGTAAALPCEYDEKTGEVRMPNKKSSSARRA